MKTKAPNNYYKSAYSFLIINSLFLLKISGQTSDSSLASLNTDLQADSFIKVVSNTPQNNSLFDEEINIFDFKNSVEGSILLPIAPGNEISFKYTRRIWKKEKNSGEFVTGIHFHLNSERDGGTYDDYQIILGYRHFFWKGLNFEAGLQPKIYYRLENATFSDRTHEGYGLFVYSMAGYQLSLLKKQKYSLIVNVQPVGLAYSAYHSDNWAKDAEGNEADDLLYFGNISVGIRF
ncbi:hypothetical protein J8281_06505 [Aquimarina sp. U1-2]|uniref:hypothetical protein n=1 Tax=Aquimarina sp. U1-2 TaxID=2823141 RepID=UPI001AEC97DF|nr:hypothetical protein [Aquimarina sp. U1-2]MBP2831836.1 hypothetical protein [Aquimarina sp. U1-2]